jgi:hypothetical protein
VALAELRDRAARLARLGGSAADTTRAPGGRGRLGLRSSRRAHGGPHRRPDGARATPRSRRWSTTVYRRERRMTCRMIRVEHLPATLDRFRLLERIATGGMADVFLAIERIAAGRRSLGRDQARCAPTCSSSRSSSSTS